MSQQSIILIRKLQFISASPLILKKLSVGNVILNCPCTSKA